MLKKILFYLLLVVSLTYLSVIILVFSYAWKNHISPGVALSGLILSLPWSPSSDSNNNGAACQAPASDDVISPNPTDADFLKFVKPSVLGNGLNPATLEKEPSSKFNDLNICLAADFFSQNTPDYFSGDEYYNYAMIRMLVARDNNNCNSFSKELMENCNSFYYKLVSLKDYSDKVISNLTDDAKLIVLALVDGSADHCNLVNDQYDKKLCFAMAAGNPDMCVFDRSIAANDCIKSKQDDGGTIGCKLEAERAEKRCQSTVYLSKASKTSDKGICDMINDRFMREYCIVLNMDDDYNLKTEVNNFFHDNFCYEKYALDAVKEKKDQQLCEKIPQRDSDNKIMHEECLAIFSKD